VPLWRQKEAGSGGGGNFTDFCSPLSTHNTACTYLHKFRLDSADSEYTYQDAALASLLLACKVEDTLKKPKDLLYAAISVKNPDKPVVQDDKVCGSLSVFPCCSPPPPY
jgi:hypothetical protein